ncbi:MAG: glycoside hydrolase family 43 protein [Marinilabiliaceae bacterium]|nr:glycoside hydrolase family 43 protein [Marinilabiliaceae bacterium]
MNRLYKFFLAAIVSSSICIETLATELSSTQVETLYNTYFKDATPTRVSVHDPSIVIGYENNGVVTGVESEGSRKIYCIFGSHRAWAKSYDLQNWTTFTNNISTSYATIFADDATWSKNGSSSYDVSGNMWAPDVVWNPTMGKWCMYMSINGDNWYSSIVLLTADNLLGNWTRVGAVVYSGFTSSNWKSTDLDEVLGVSTFPDRYVQNRNGNRTYGMNCIDPCTFFDEDGNMWMTYGSWFGGLYMLKLDPSTGLRDATYTYETNDGTPTNALSDAYQGIKIYGGFHVSGEASYIEYIGDRYYLFVTYGGLTATGGYNMRVFSSKDVTGPYYDLSGQDARYTSSSSINSNNCCGTVNGYVGTRLMSYYRWSFMNYGYTAQGHNSAVVDSDGKTFLVYHTRFDDGTEGHQVRVHQMFQTSNGGLAAAPFEYKGETLSATPYDASEIVGTYSILYHGFGTSYSSLQCVTEKQITLNEDGTVSGAYTGTWTQSTNGPEMSIMISGASYKGVFLKQCIEETNYTTLCFTATCESDICVWGYKTFSDEAVVAYNAYNFDSSLPTTAFSGLKLNLPSAGVYGATIEWKSQNVDVITDDGEVKEVDSDTDVTLTETITCGEVSYSKNVNITVKSIANLTSSLPIDESAIMGIYSSSDEFKAATPSSNITTETGLSISFQMNETINSDWTPIAKSTDGKYIMYLSVLHYNDNDFYEAAAQSFNGGSYTSFYNKKYYVTISFNPDGTVSYYRDGVLMLTYAANIAPNWHATTVSATTPTKVVEAVINYYLKNQINFQLSVSNIVVGYAVGYTAPSPTPVHSIADNNITISSSHRTITIVGKATNDVCTIYDMRGAIVARGTQEQYFVNAPGIYIVSVGNTCSKIIID